MRRSAGVNGKRPTEGELLIKDEIRKGLVASQDLKRDTILADDDISYARPAHGYKASERSKIIGKKLITAVKKGEIFHPDLF